MNAIILAGGRINEDLRQDREIEAKAQLLLLGRPMVQYAIQAARGCGPLQRVCVVAGEWFRELQAATDVDHFVPEEGDEADNLFAALDALGSDQPTLMLAADSPLVTSPMLEAFLARCPPEADVVYTFVEKHRIMERFADRRGRSGTTKDGWVFVRLAEGQFTGSSLVYFRPKALRRSEELLRRVLDARRQNWRLALIVGPGLIIRAILQQLVPSLPAGRQVRILSWHDIQRRMADLAQCNAVGLVSEEPELAFDVDYPTDVELAERELRARGWEQAQGGA